MTTILWILFGFALGIFVYHKWFHVVDDSIEWIKDKFKK
jgi:hypothetical protein